MAQQREQTQETLKESIILNRMYDGKYIHHNLGHEVINLFTEDKGRHYIYLNSDGKTNGISYKYMLLIKRHCQGIIEIIGKAINLSVCFDSKKNENQGKQIDDIKYGNVKITDIFKGDKWQGIYVSYLASEVYIPTQRMFIHLPSTKDFKEDNDNTQKELEFLIGKQFLIVQLRNHVQALQSQRQYVDKTEEADDDYSKLYNAFFANNDNWTKLSDENKVPSNLSDYQFRDISLFDICDIQDSENRFSNAFAYFLKQDAYRELWVDFFKQLQDEEGNSIGLNLNCEYNVTREENAKVDKKSYKNKTGGRIDLTIRDDNHFIMIENKIKSSINSKESDKKIGCNQLDRYYNYAEWLTKKNKEGKDVCKKIYAFLLVPNYNIPKVAANWRIITYKHLYDFLKNNYFEFKDDTNFKHFYDAIKRHTYVNFKDFLYDEMKENFYKRIKVYHL